MGTGPGPAGPTLLLAHVDGAELTFTPIAAVGPGGELEPMTPRAPDGGLVEVPSTVRAS